MTSGLLRRLITLGVKFEPVVSLQDGQYCGRCGANMRLVDSTCWHCSGRKPPLAAITRHRRGE